jgi:hypothetical protein
VKADGVTDVAVLAANGVGTVKLPSIEHSGRHVANSNDLNGLPVYVYVVSARTELGASRPIKPNATANA